MRKRRMLAVLALLFSAAALRAQQPPEELMRYIREARKAGVSDPQAQKNAVSAGWPAAMVVTALQNPAASPGGETAAAAVAPEAAPRTPAVKVGDTPTIKKDHGTPDDYIIGEGDVLHISVWKEPDASVASVVVRPDGRVSMPLLKEVKISGMTPGEAETMITAALQKFITAPDVTVIVSQINSKRVYIVGGVKKEGPIAYTYRMTVLQALSEAGGLTDYAKKKKIYVLRHENGRDYRLRFDYDAALRGEHMELNIRLLPGDTIVVPK